MYSGVVWCMYVLYSEVSRPVTIRAKSQRTHTSCYQGENSDFLPQKTTFAQSLRISVSPPHPPSIPHPHRIKSSINPSDSQCHPPPPTPPDPPTRLLEQSYQGSNAGSTRSGPQTWATEMEVLDALPSPNAEDELMEAWLEVTSQQNMDGSVNSSPVVTKLLTVLLRKVKETLKEARKTSTRVERLEAKIAGMTESPPSIPSKPMSWVTAAKLPAKPAKITPTVLTRPNPPPPSKVINSFKPSHVIIRKPDDESKTPFKGCTPSEIVEEVTKALRKIDAKIEDAPIGVKAAQLLPSGDVKLYTAT